MFLVLLATLGLLTWWLVSKMDSVKETIERIQPTLTSDELKDAIREAVLEALEEHDDPYPVPFGPFEEGYEEREKEWKERHGQRVD